jgi:hypothetical protein
MSLQRSTISQIQVSFDAVEILKVEKRLIGRKKFSSWTKWKNRFFTTTTNSKNVSAFSAKAKNV